MRKFTLFLAGLAVAGISFGQVHQIKEAPVMQEKYTAKSDVGQLKAGGDTIWSTSFNWKDEAEPRGWKLPEGWTNVDETGLGNAWTWRDDTLKGRWTSQPAPAHFTTADDGFIAVPIDEYNIRDEVPTNNVAGTYIETPPIDCSAAPSVVVNFNQQFRLCCSDYNCEMLVTNDGGVHWALYDVRFGVAGNTVTPDKFKSPSINVSDVAAGMGQVQIRFYFHGPAHYYWMLDDLTLTEAYQNDLVLVDYWSDFNDGNGMDRDMRVGHINYWPLSQMGQDAANGGKIGDYLFTGALLNDGMADQENAMTQMTILKNGEQVFQSVSPGATLWPLDRDTSTVADTWLGDDYGDYLFTFEAVSDNNEEHAINNSSSVRFTINDTLMHRADFSAESSSNSGGWVGGSNAGDMVGVGYDIFETTEVNAITAYISGVTVADDPTYQFVLLKYIVEDDFYEEWILSDIYEADSTIRRTWQTHELEKDGETEFLEPGFYVACVRFWGDNGTDEGSNGMSVGWDMDAKWRGWYSHVLFVGGETHFNPGKMNMIGLVLNEEGGPGMADATFNVDMNAHIMNGEFNVGSDFVDLAGSFNGWTGSDHMTDADGDGIYTISVTDLPVGEVIEYKYRINANWDTSEFPDGGPNRRYTVRYWNVINNIYNNGETTGIENLSVFESFRVYPNPTQGVFTVDVQSTRTTDLDISLVDMQGRVMYQNSITGVTSHREIIDTELAKGIYFLSINNGKEVKVQKLIVQ